MSAHRDLNVKNVGEKAIREAKIGEQSSVLNAGEGVCTKTNELSVFNTLT